jgi:hypothetical protein
MSGRHVASAGLMARATSDGHRVEPARFSARAFAIERMRASMRARRRGEGATSLLSLSSSARGRLCPAARLEEEEGGADGDDAGMVEAAKFLPLPRQEFVAPFLHTNLLPSSPPSKMLKSAVLAGVVGAASAHMCAFAPIQRGGEFWCVCCVRGCDFFFRMT